MKRGFEVVKDEFRFYPNCEIVLPTRGTKHSAGYDIYAPVTFEIPPHQEIKVMTDVKAYMQEDEVLLLTVRSSIGIKKHLMLSNTIGVIDSDFYSNESNDGNICLALRNMSNEYVKIEKGERVCQGIFVKYLTIDNEDENLKVRSGGIGSTNK